MSKIVRALIPALLAAAAFSGDAFAFNPQPDPPAKFKLVTGQTFTHPAFSILPPSPCKTACPSGQIPKVTPCQAGIACPPGH